MESAGPVARSVMFTVGSWNVVLGWTGPGTCITRLPPDWLIVLGPVPRLSPPEIENETSVEFAGTGMKTLKSWR